MHPALLKLQPFDIAARLVHLARCQSRREQGLGDIDTSQITEQRPYEPARESLATFVLPHASGPWIYLPKPR